MNTEINVKPALARRERFYSSAVLAGDRTRASVTDYLGLAYAEGYIPREEFEARMGRALSARTEDYLARLLRDLPAEIRREAAVTAMPRAESDDSPDYLVVLACVAAFIVVVAVVVTFMTVISHRTSSDIPQQQFNACLQQQYEYSLSGTFCPLPGQ
jgi:Domain of unknown function (DUF1707)